MRHLLPVAVAASFIVVGCGTPTTVTAEQGMAQLGLTPGTTLTYASSTGGTETHEHGVSDLQLLGATTVGITAKEQGFAVEERSMVVGVDIAEVTLLRFFNCLTRCATLDQPISFVAWPLEAGATLGGEATVSESSNGEIVQTRVERHRTIIGDLADVTVPAGTFPAYPVSWSRTIVDGTGAEVETTTTTLQWAPDVGIVSWRDDDVELELSTR